MAASEEIVGVGELESLAAGDFVASPPSSKEILPRGEIWMIAFHRSTTFFNFEPSSSPLFSNESLKKAFSCSQG
ncbi:unnamed protein product [Linum trigynum]|uniref:Uncharacterized protein n=1 Tax=Linum trigynum TaxID=586398 RepID=A0AAV2F8J4_9ROSI